jgi:hypothetical protein
MKTYNQLSYEQVEKLFNKKGFTLITKEYENNQKKMECIDKDGYKLIISYGKLSTGRTPSKFGKGNPNTIENIKLFLKINSIPYELLSIKFKTACKDKLLWKCDNNHIFEMSWNSFYSSGYRCMYCSGNAKKTTKIFKEEIFNLVNHEYTLLSEYINDTIHVTIKHNGCGHVYEVSPSHFLKNRRCPNCRYKSGPEHFSYNPNIPDEEREKGRFLHREKLKVWRTDVFSRDNFTCQLCYKKGSTLHAHHLNGYHWDKNNRFNKDNGITLCKTCHRAFHCKYGMRNNTKEQFEAFKQNNEQLQHA